MVMLLSFYTFITVFSIRINFLDIFLPATVITILSYAWFLIMASRQGRLVIDYDDLVMQIFIYCFISFFVAFASLIFLGGDMSFVHILLLESPIVVWIVVWTDSYFHRSSGNL